MLIRWRIIILFAFGTSLAIVLNLLQFERKVTNFPKNFLISSWWVPIACGFAAVLIGIWFPWMDDQLEGWEDSRRLDWSSIIRCIALFVGINQATAKIAFTNSLHLTLTLFVLSIGLWWLFDRSRIGLINGIIFSILATFITQLLVYLQFFTFTSPDFFYVRSWLPSIFFSGAITIGMIGRQLAST
ncbi:hypothetical protein SNEBB_003690 [Seison nebaliae]|nr:hypothetical protein SNEBB_003690 [Seison nebaliae]